MSNNNDYKKKTMRELGFTTIGISIKNYEKLRRLGFAGDSYNDIISRILETYTDMSRETLIEENNKKNE